MKEWEDIIKEVTITRNLNHENIIHYVGSYIHDQAIYLVLDFCQGSLLDLVQISNGLEEKEIAAMTYYILLGKKKNSPFYNHLFIFQKIKIIIY